MVKYLFVFSGLFFSIVTVISLLVPPLGVIDNSVIAVIGELGTFVTIWGAILDGRKVHRKKGDDEIKLE